MKRGDGEDEVGVERERRRMNWSHRCDVMEWSLHFTHSLIIQVDESISEMMRVIFQAILHKGDCSR